MRHSNMVREQLQEERDCLVISQRKVLLIDCKLIMNSLDVIINLEFSVNKAIFVGNSPVYL